MPNLTITFQGNLISPETFCERFGEYLIKQNYSSLFIKPISKDLLAFLKSMEI